MLTFDLPDQLARQWGDTPAAVQRHVLEDAAIEGYRAGRLSVRQFGAVLGLDYWQAELLLQERGVELNYGVDDLVADSIALGRILPIK